MHALLVSHRFPPDGVAGVERVTQSLAAELVKRGDTVSIVTRRTTPPPSTPRRIRELLPDGTRLYRFTGGEMSLDRPFLHHERLDPLFTEVLAASMPDVVHFHHLAGLSPSFVEIAHRLRVPIVIELHDFYFACPLVHLQKSSGELCDGPDGGRECARTCFRDGDSSTLTRWGLRSAYFRRILGLAQRIVSPSDYVATFFERLGVDSTRIHVLPNGLSIDTGEMLVDELSSPKRRGTLNLACVGTVVAHKGVHLILEALRDARLKSVDLIVIGSIADREYANDLRSRAALIPGLTMRLYGAYEREILPHLLHDVDYVVTPSIVPEAGPVTPREAMACGIPVIATRLGALPEIVLDQENGLTFDHRRPGQLAEILRRVAEDEHLLQRLRAGVRATDLPTITMRMEAVRALYGDAISEVAGTGELDAPDLAETEFLRDALLNVGLIGGNGLAGPRRRETIEA